MKLYAYIAAALLVLSLFGGTYYKGYSSGKATVQAEWDLDAANRLKATNKAILDRVAENKRKADQDEADKLAMKRKYDNELAQVHADYDRLQSSRLRIPGSACNRPAATDKGTGAGGSDPASSGTIPLPESIEQDLRRLMLEADTVVAGCRVAQDFIRSQGMAP